MSASYYTSYHTSLALRDAGAPQDLPSGYMGGYYINEYPERVREFDRGWSGVVWTTRAFRLDEILEALEKLGTLEIEHASPGDSWHVELVTENGRPFCCAGEYAKVDGEGTCCWWPTLVEAAAACWLAVLRAAREAKS